MNDQLPKQITWYVALRAKHTNRTEFRRDNAEASQPVDLLKVKALKPSIVGDQAVDGLLRDEDAVELELLEFGEKMAGP